MMGNTEPFDIIRARQRRRRQAAAEHEKSRLYSSPSAARDPYALRSLAPFASSGIIGIPLPLRGIGISKPLSGGRHAQRRGATGALRPTLLHQQDAHLLQQLHGSVHAFGEKKISARLFLVSLHL